MSETRFTPGPWADGPPAWYRGRTNEAHGKRPINSTSHPAAGVIANVYGEANAALIAAAPDLYAALAELHASVRGECPSLLNEDSGGDAALALRIEAALAKARGEQP